MEKNMRGYDVAAYVWPAYTGDELRSRIFWPNGIGEWQTVMEAKAKFPGHQWPRKPVWGYVNEADPYVMEMQISAAVEHGVNVFIYDWYWFDNRPFLENCLNDGFLKAKNNDQMKFYIMWANHNVNNLWYKSLADGETGKTIIWSGTVTREEFECIGHRLIEKYFKHPSYYKIDEKPVLLIHDTINLMLGLGGIENARAALDWLREETIKAGFPGLHLQMGTGGAKEGNDVYARMSLDRAEVLSALGYDSATTYSFMHMTNVDRDYNEIINDVNIKWEELYENLGVPYFPHVSVGWDTSSRFVDYVGLITKNNTPENVENALRKAKEFVDTHELPARLITVNSWNEWTEGSYLQPDDIYGYGYLEAVKKVFKGEGL